MNQDRIQAMIQQSTQALKSAYAPYSGFAVAASILATNGQIYTGVNVENASFGLTLCAEASAIAQMILHGQRKIESMVILSQNNELCSPCGACRQRIHEFSTPETPIHLCTQEKLLQTCSISSLLPLAFEFKH